VSAKEFFLHQNPFRNAMYYSTPIECFVFTFFSKKKIESRYAGPLSLQAIFVYCKNQLFQFPPAPKRPIKEGCCCWNLKGSVSVPVEIDERRGTLGAAFSGCTRSSSAFYKSVQQYRALHLIGFRCRCISNI